MTLNNFWITTPRLRGRFWWLDDAADKTFHFNPLDIF